MAKGKRELVLIPIIKIHPSKIITYNEINWYPHPPPRKTYNSNSSTLITVETENGIQLKRISNKFIKSSRQGNGTLSKQAKKRLKLAIEYFLLLNKPQNGKTGNTGRHYNNQITFITLTLPSKQIHTDNEIKSKLLNQFLIEISKYNLVNMYIWRAEYQKNGNIHFHILANKFIPWQVIRNRWNRILNKLGYIDRYRAEQEEYHKNGFKLRTDLLNKWSKEAQLKAYHRGKRLNWRDPNSTDIHKIQNITNIKDYLTKYLSKTDQQKEENLTANSEVKKEIGRTWAASTIISNIKGASSQIDSRIEPILEYLKKYFPERIYKGEYFTVIEFSIFEIESYKCAELFNLFYSYMNKEFNYSKQLSL